MILFKSYNGKYEDNRKLWWKGETNIKLKSNQIKT